jgi:FMN-dependent NADH-azoreductase
MGGRATGRVVLRVDAGVDHGRSVSRTLADELLLTIAGDDDVVIRRDVSRGIPFVDVPWLAAAFADGDPAGLGTSDELVNELLTADELVLVAPIYNLGIPATLKAWIDQVVRGGRTFRLTATGPVGLSSIQRAWIVTCSGATEIGGPFDHNTPYLRAILGFIGIADVRVVAPAELLHPDLVAQARFDGSLAT